MRARVPRRERARVPRALTRFLRRRLRLASLALIGIVLVAASGLQSGSADALRETLDANWRGDYDILVTAGGSSPLSGASGGLLGPGALTDASLGHIANADVARVQGLEGVEVAAPIGAFTTPTTDVAKATLIVPLDGSAAGPRAYRVSTTLVIDDGVTPARTIDASVDIVVDQTAWEGYRQLRDGENRPVRAVTSAGEIAYGAETDVDRNVAWTFGGWESAEQPPPGEGVVALTLPVQAVRTAHVVLVDPVAEKKLLGDAGAVMDPLIDTSALIGRLGDNFFDPADPPSPDDDLNTLFEKGVATQPTPILTRAVDTPAAHLEVDLTPLDAPSDELATSLVRATAGDDVFPDLDAAGTAPTTTLYSGEPGDALSPLTFDSVDVPWPGWTPPPAAPYAQYPMFRLAGSPILSAVDPQATTIAHAVPADASADQSDASAPLLRLRATGESDGELLFSATTPFPGTDAGTTGPYETNTWPVGTFTPAQLQEEGTELGQVGLGYDESAPIIVDGADAAADGTALPASFSGLGLNTSGAFAIADLQNAQYLHMADPVSSVRVRVAGIDGYTADAQAKILDVASRIRELGLTATIVAGSSFETVPVALEPPAGTSGDAPPLVVSQDYSRLGAAAMASDGVSGTNLALLMMSMLAATALLLFTQLSSIASRRADAAVLRQVGWTRRRIRAWFLSEEAVATLLLAGIGALTLLTSAMIETTSYLVGIAVAASVVGSAVLVGRSALVRASAARRPRSGSGAVTTPALLGLRNARTSGATTVALAAALALVSLAASTAVAVLIAGRAAAGDSRLGSFAASQALVPQGTLIAVTLGAAGILLVVIRRLGLERRTSAEQALRAMGWQRTHLRHAAAAEIFTAAVPGVVTGAALATAGALAFAPSATVAAVVVGTIAATAAGLILVSDGARSSGRRESARRRARRAR
ncbi:hypothetical protein QE374_002146 [Microbacterium sp. SORGH_AS428]|uniref:hypothetical protein n=1 Tax=Microbacterium sp. SORGH_AS_0428 TaxID=3041788 RepID=UPI0028552C96|nr:hypothetical protein [Microbacterium sp. SORGH_AS_0428]MDR6200237.1 hypothetical protein [Microbacterium sp. SORGH_AS_0428]